MQQPISIVSLGTHRSAQLVQMGPDRACKVCDDSHGSNYYSYCNAIMAVRRFPTTIIALLRSASPTARATGDTGWFTLGSSGLKTNTTQHIGIPIVGGLVGEV